MEAFDLTKINLYEILKEVDNSKIQLPEFQRGWVWDDDRIKGLLASVAKSYPIGAIMLLETGNESIKFKTKPVEGVKNISGNKPEMLILDGQQRITSLYQTIISNEVVNTKNSKGYDIKRWYYIDMKKALDPSSDMDDAIFSINENKNIGRDIVLDLSTEEKEFENFMYPVNKLDEYCEWRMKFIDFWKNKKEGMESWKEIELWNNFEMKIINNFKSYNIPIIILKKDNPKDAVCQVFEKVNTGGMSLTVFELLTASFAADDYDLKADWKSIKDIFKEFRVLANTSNIDIIQAITLFSTYKKRCEDISQGKSSITAVSAKRKDMLNLSLNDYKKYKDIIINGFIKAAKILTENHIYKANDLPYTTQLIPMAAILAELGNIIDNIGNKNKLMQWFWCGVFGELYGSANETRYAKDMTQVTDWIKNNNNEIPRTIYDANFSPDRLFTLRSRNSAAYKGVYALLMDDNIKDWLTATKIDFSTYFSEAIDIHHIFPVAWCKKNNIPRNYYDSIVNKTPLSGRTNRIVSGYAPSKYLERLKNNARISDDDFYNILKSHLVDLESMNKDDFYSFFEYRKEQILQKIEKAMGKPIPRNQKEEGEFNENEEYVEENELEN
ncbi:MAG TPA: DUF262 domain-containing protein [Bacteroidales bacterium]|nr:DUF262 domain-containing protein [Bacteroidales bacterium]